MTLTINKLLWYTIQFTIVLLALTGCASAPIECASDTCEEQQGIDDMKNLIGRLTSSMIRTTEVGSEVTGLPTGRLVRSLQATDLQPGQYTLQFQALPPADGNGFAAYATVNWKVGGQQLTRKLSVFSGAAITGVAEAVDVELVDVSNINLGPLTASPYEIAVQLAPGGRGATMQPPTLLTRPNTTTIPAQSVQAYAIPQGAGVISANVLTAIDNAFIAAAPITEVAALARDPLGVNLSAWYPNAQSPGWVPLPGSAVQILVVNKSAANAIQCQIIWGIEG